METLFAKVDFSPLEYCCVHFYYNSQFYFQVKIQFERLTEMPLLGTLRTGLLKFSQGLVNLPFLEKVTTEIKGLRKKIQESNIEFRKECKSL